MVLKFPVEFRDSFRMEESAGIVEGECFLKFSGGFSFAHDGAPERSEKSDVKFSGFTSGNFMKPIVGKNGYSAEVIAFSGDSVEVLFDGFRFAVVLCQCSFFASR